MKKIFTLLGVVSIVLLSSCSQSQQKPTSPVGTVVPQVNYPTTQAETPATKYCSAHGGTVSVEKDGTGGVDVAYCTLSDGTKVDAWKYMSEDTNKTVSGAQK